MAEYVRGRGWPTRSCDLLLRAALCSADIAAESWRLWQAEFGLDQASWAEVRLLAAVAKRADLGLDKRVAGIRKFVWAQTQMQLVPAAEGLEALAAVGIPLLLLKGAARVAVDPAVASERLIRDVDVLVPVEQASLALETLIAHGWQFEGWQAKQREIHPIDAHHAWSVRRGRGEVDLHHYSNFLNRSEGIDSRLWDRSIPVTWRCIRVRVPAPADALLLALIHGLRWSRERAADWVLDSQAAIASGVDWDALVMSAQARGMGWIAYQGLTYLRERVQCPVPDSVLTTLLLGKTPTKEQQLYFYAYVPFVGI